MKKENAQHPFIKNIVTNITVLMLLFAISCKSTKPTGATTVKPATYPTADGFAQKPLAYNYAALAPFSTKETVKSHFIETQSSYLNKLNKVIFAHESMMGKSLEELLQGVSKLPEDVRSIIRENGGGYWNHTFFWKGLTTKKNTQPNEQLRKAIISKWGSIKKFKKKFEKVSTVKYGQCWVWLVNTEKGLKISRTDNEDNPLMDISKIQGKPIIAIDLWKHSLGAIALL